MPFSRNGREDKLRVALTGFDTPLMSGSRMADGGALRSPPMQRPFTRLTRVALLLASGSQSPIDLPQAWQADIQIRTLEVTRTKTSVSARVVVYTENDDDAQNARLLILLPIGVGIGRIAPTCTATPGPSMVPSLRAIVTCELGVIPNRGFREVVLTTTVPANTRPRRFGVFTYSTTPDPIPGNNYAERTIP